MPPVARLIKEVKGETVGAVKMVAIREHRFPFLVKVRPTVKQLLRLFLQLFLHMPGVSECERLEWKI